MSRLVGPICFWVIMSMPCPAQQTPKPTDGDFGWEVLNADDKKKIFAQYAPYIHPGKDGKPHAKFNEAKLLMSRRDDELTYILPAIFAWSDLHKKAGNESTAGHHLELMQTIINRGFLARTPKFVAKLPDRLIDEHFFVMKMWNQPGPSMERIGDFGPRAAHLSKPLRDWFFETKGGGDRVNVGQLKIVLDQIEKKK